jgi:drug/metabolite transporter (DMT)-like permease
MLAVLYLVVFGSWVGYTAYIWLLKHVPTPKVATYAYVNPLVAVFLGWFFHDEPLDAFMLTGAAIIVAGVALVTTAKIHEGGEGSPSVSLPELESEV